MQQTSITIIILYGNVMTR